MIFNRKKSLLRKEKNTPQRAQASPSFQADVQRSYADLYASQPAVRACVDFLANAIATTPLHAYQRAGDDRVRLPESNNLVRLLRNPNPRTTGFRHRRDLAADVLTHGNAYEVKVCIDGEIVSLVRLPPGTVTLLLQNQTDIAGYRVSLGFSWMDFPVDDVVHYKLYSPRDSRVGVSPLESLRDVLLEEQGASAWRKDFWANGAQPSMIITRPLDAPDWDSDTYDRFLEGLRAAASRGKPMVLQEGMTSNPQGAFRPVQTEFVEGRKLTFESVAAVYGLAPQTVGLSDRNLSESHRNLYQDTLPPDCELMEDEINLSLVPDVLGYTQTRSNRVFVEYLVEDKLRGSFREQFEAVTAAVGGSWMTPDEARRLYNLPALAGGDRLLPPRQSAKALKAGSPKGRGA